MPEALLVNEIRLGFEGITVAGDWLWMAVQREWKDDAAGMVKLAGYNTAEETWGLWITRPMRCQQGAAEGAWMGLSEITASGDWVYIVERDNHIGAAAASKKLYRVPVSAMVPAELGGASPVVKKEMVRDLLPDLAVLKGYAAEKIEGFAIDSAGTGWVVTDNDGVPDSAGETLFWSIGAVQEAWACE